MTYGGTMQITMKYQDNDWSYLLFKTKLCYFPTPHKKFSLNKNMPNYYL